MNLKFMPKGNDSRYKIVLEILNQMEIYFKNYF